MRHLLESHVFGDRPAEVVDGADGAASEESSRRNLLAAGPIVEHLSWRRLLWLPLVVVALLGVIVGMPESPVGTPGRLDVAALAIVASLAVPGTRRRRAQALAAGIGDLPLELPHSHREGARG